MEWRRVSNKHHDFWLWKQKKRKRNVEQRIIAELFSNGCRVAYISRRGNGEWLVWQYGDDGKHTHGYPHPTKIAAQNAAEYAEIMLNGGDNNGMENGSRV